MCSSRVRKFPSQLRRKLSAALKTVGILNVITEPSRAVRSLLLSAPLLCMSWQDEQVSVPSCDRRGSAKSRSPRASFRGSAGGGRGTGVIGSCCGRQPVDRGVVTGGGRSRYRDDEQQRQTPPSARDVKTNRRRVAGFQHASEKTACDRATSRLEFPARSVQIGDYGSIMAMRLSHTRSR